MNFTESFSEFSSKLSPLDLSLYAGIGIVLCVLFKDQLSPVQKVILDFLNKFNKKISNNIQTDPGSVVAKPEKKDIFFDLVVSWKQTRDLASKSGCQKAVEVADQMFPYLSPMVCDDTEATDAKA